MLLWMLLVSCSCVVRETRAGTETEMRALLDAKLNSTDYSARVRPIKDTGNVLSVTIDMFLIGINTVDEVEQKVTTTAYLDISWSDTFLTWTPASYGNIDKISIPQQLIWKPDLALANAFDTITGLGDKFMYVTVTSAGVINWQPYQVFDSSCSLDMTYFPFDTQTCELQLVTWSSTKEMINLQAGTIGFSTTEYETNANWDLLSVKVEDASSSTTAGLAFKMNIKRKPVFYLLNFIIPIVLLTMLNVFVFILPCDSGEKTGYAIVLFLSFAVFLLIVTEIMPEGMSTIPVMSTYLLLACVMSTLVVFVTIIQLRLHNQGDDTPVPRFLKTFVHLVFAAKSKACCDAKEHAVVDDESDETETDVKVPIEARSSARTEKTREAMANGTTSDESKSGPNKLKDMLQGNGRKVAPIVSPKTTRPATVSNRNEDIELQELEDEHVDVDDQATLYSGKQTKNGAPSTYAGRQTNGAAPSIFTAKKSQNFTRNLDETISTDSTDDAANNDVSWSDVSTAMDIFFFILFSCLNGIATFVAFVVAAVH